MSWQPTVNLTSIFNRIARERPEASILVDKIIRKAGENRIIGRSDFKSDSRRDKYIIYFTLPVAELTGWPTHPPDRLDEWLAAHLALANLWRAVDDLLDAPVVPDLRPTLLPSILTAGFRVAIALEKLGHPTHDTLNLIDKMIEVASAERQSPLSVDRIWERASPFFVVPAALLEERNLALLRLYVNFMGLLHDIQDVHNDIEIGIKSLPALWLKAAVPKAQLTPAAMQVYFRQTATELAKMSCALKNALPERARILSVILDEECTYASQLNV